MYKFTYKNARIIDKWSLLMQNIKIQEDDKRQGDECKKKSNVKKHCGRLLKVVVFVLMIAIAAGNLGEVLAYKHDEYDANNYFDFDYLYDLPKDSLDVVYLGTSQFHMGITPLEIWKKYGITGANFTSSANRAWLAYYMLEEILKYQNPKVVVMDAALIRGGNNNVVGNRRIISQFRFSPLKLEALYNCLELKGKSIDEMINISSEFFAYHDRWDSLTQYDFADDVSSYAYQKGYLLSISSTPHSNIDYEEYHTPVIFKIEEQTKLYMEKIKKLCDEKEIEIMVTKLPSEMWNPTYSKIVEDWADENQALFLDMTQKKILRKMNFDLEKDYLDFNHINYSGAELVSDYLGSYLTENYEFDEKSEKIEAAWDADYKKYEDYRSTYMLKLANNLTDFIELAKQPDYVICFSIKDEATQGLTDQELEELQSLGINIDFAQNYRGSMVAIVDNGETVIQNFGQEEQICEYHPYENLEIEMISKGYNAGNQSSIVINGQEYSKNLRGMNVVVYDKKKNEVICSSVFDTWTIEGE